MTTAPPPPRIFAAFSNDPARNIVLRRGPGRQVALFMWNRKTDSFNLGQWLKGRVYEHRLDLSPDGQYMIYLALKKGEAHTVVSRTPYFTALDYYEWGDTWGGGGLFIPSKNFLAQPNGYRLNGSPSLKFRQTSGLPVWNLKTKDTDAHRLCFTIYPQRLIRDGWQMENAHTFIKPFDKNWTLVKHIGQGKRDNRSLEHEFHTLINVKSSLCLEKPNWEWAEIAGQYIYFAEAGVIYKAKAHVETGITAPKKLHDFTDYTFEERRAPYA